MHSFSKLQNVLCLLLASLFAIALSSGAASAHRHPYRPHGHAQLLSIARKHRRSRQNALFLLLASLFVIALSSGTALAFTIHPQQQHRGLSRRTQASPRAVPVAIHHATAPTVSEPATTQVVTFDETQKSSRHHQQENNHYPTWELRLYNDDYNTREYVGKILVQVAGLSESQAFSTMKATENHGVGIVGLYCFEVAEMYHEGLRTRNLLSEILPVEDGTNE